MRRIIAFNEGERILILRRFVLVEGEDQIAVRGMAINACLGVKRLQTGGLGSTCVHELRLCWFIRTKASKYDRGYLPEHQRAV